MKTHKVLFLALFVSAVFAVSAQAGNRNRNGGNAKTSGSSPAHYSGGAIHSSSSVRYGGGRTFASSPRMMTRSMPSQRFAQRSGYTSGGNVGSFNRSNRVARFQSNRNFGTIQGTGGGNRLSSLNNTGRNFNRTGGQSNFVRSGNNRNLGTFQGTGGRNRTIGNISPGHNHVFGQRSANWNHNWDRHSDHWWNGHRCRWVNNSWFIFDIGFVPWFGWPYYDYYAYDYYPPVYPFGYGYGYNSGGYYGSNYYNQNGYDSSYYDQGQYNNYNGQSNYYDQGNSNSYDQGGNGLGSNERATVADVQDQLARAGYYRGKIDGVLGPETRHALLSYQSAKGLRMTGSLTPETQQSLGLTAQGGDQITDQ